VESKTTGAITETDAQTLGAGLLQQLRDAGAMASLHRTSVTKLKGVSVAVLELEVHNVEGGRKLRQYVIPGKTTSAILTYAASRRDYDRQLPEFEASMQATIGAHDHGKFHLVPFVKSLFGGSGSKASGDRKGIRWDEVFYAGAIGAVVAGIASVVLRTIRRRRAGDAGDEDAGAGVSPAPKKAAPRKPTKHLWYCEQCGNPVPLRLGECRCGGKKPG
jgi:hypothetical protein